MRSKRHTSSLQQEKRKKKKKSLGFKIFLVILIILLIAVAAGSVVAYKGYTYLDSKVSSMDQVETDINDFAIDQKVDKSLSDYTNIALLGVDARLGEDKEFTRTDAIIIVSIHNETHEITLTSVMRDSYLQIQNQNKENILDKITHANVFGGPVNTCRALNKSLDLNISQFVVMDWKTVADTVDSLGGITMDVQENEIWDLNHWGPETALNTGREKYNAIVKPGKQKLDGVQAATYCRIRKNSGGDPGRTQRMRKVVYATIDKIKSNPKLVMSLADDVFPSVTTNINTKQIIKLAPIALDFNMKNNYVYPFDYAGVELGDTTRRWYAVPTTLEENCKILHKIIFKQENYEPSKQCKELSKTTAEETGWSLGTEINPTGNKKLDKEMYSDIFESGALEQLKQHKAGNYIKGIPQQ